MKNTNHQKILKKKKPGKFNRLIPIKGIDYFKNVKRKPRL